MEGGLDNLIGRREFLKFAVAGAASIPIFIQGCESMGGREEYEGGLAQSKTVGPTIIEVKPIDGKAKIAYEIPCLQIKTLEEGIRGKEILGSEKDVKVDIDFLNWELGIGMEQKNYSFQIISKSLDGKVLYSIKQPNKADEESKYFTGSIAALVIFDPSKIAKTYFIYGGGRCDVESRLSDQGNLLYLGLPKIVPCAELEGVDTWKITEAVDPSNPKSIERCVALRLFKSGGTYLIDLSKNMKILYHDFYFGIEHNPIFSEDENVFYANKRLFNISTKRIRTTDWRRDYTFYDVQLSPNGNYAACDIGLFPSLRTVEGQWGIEVNTPERTYVIESFSRSLTVKTIENDGTIYSNQGYVFRQVGDTYKCVKWPEGRQLNDLMIW